VNPSIRQQLQNRKRRIFRRLVNRQWEDQLSPMLAASNIHYELSDRIHGLDCGGIGVIHLLARQTGLIDAINNSLHLLKVHLPYWESDHVLNIAYNLLVGGECLQDIELRRNDEVYLDSLGAQRIPDPTTAGDFCRRFSEADVLGLMEAINGVRQGVWKQQPPEFFQRAILDADGTVAPTTGQCKQGMDLHHSGQWGYHPLLISLANTKEPLYLINRSGNRPSNEQAGEYFDRAIALCRAGGFQSVLLRGDTDFSQCRRLDGWNDDGVEFLFGLDAMPNLKEYANRLPESAWQRLDRPPRYEVKTQPRQRPENVKEQLVVEHEYKNIRLVSEDVAEFDYRPTDCKHFYRVVVVRKNLSVERGELALYDEIRYFFYITNVRDQSTEQIVLLANDRCDQENLIEQLKNGVKALRMPVDNLVSNWAYMVMGSLGWTLKAWWGLWLPVSRGRWQQRHEEQKQSVLKMEFKRFVNAVVRVPCQIVRQGRKIIYRLLAWNPWQEVMMRMVEALRRPMRC
jgi:hypothetical protein